jgi:2,5-diketo-D-gluconate reductase A
MTDQPTLTLNDGRVAPQFGLGVWKAPADEVEQTVRVAVEAGYRSVDTATIYGNEEGVGRALSDVDDEVFLTTKLWNDDQGYDAALRAFEASLQRLGRDSVDLYLIHWPCPGKNLFVESWKALVRLREEGRAKSIGVSNFMPVHLERIVGETGVVPAVNQIELHPRFQQRESRAYHQANGIVTESWSPLGHGRVLEDPTVAAIAAKYGKSPAQAIIRWHLDKGLMVIPKSVTPARIRQNIEVFDFELDPEDAAAIDALDDANGRAGSNPLTFG